ncbi:MAG: hypothetical protein ACPL7R_05670, partial [Anaerolineae bacterium]
SAESAEGDPVPGCSSLSLPGAGRVCCDAEQSISYSNREWTRICKYATFFVCIVAAENDAAAL